MYTYKYTNRQVDVVLLLKKAVINHVYNLVYVNTMLLLIQLDN